MNKTDQQAIADQLCQHLDSQVEQQSTATQTALAEARFNAISQSQRTSSLKWLPVGVLACGLLVVLTSTLQQPDIAPLPLANADAQPEVIEDMAMLEDIQFIQWLAENEQEMVL